VVEHLLRKTADILTSACVRNDTVMALTGRSDASRTCSPAAKKLLASSFWPVIFFGLAGSELEPRLMLGMYPGVDLGMCSLTVAEARKGYVGGAPVVLAGVAVMLLRSGAMVMGVLGVWSGVWVWGADFAPFA